MGGYYDKLLAGKLPAGSDISTYNAAPAGSDLANALNEAKKAAGPEIINATLTIPIILIIAFTALYFYMRSKKQVQAQSLSNSIA